MPPLGRGMAVLLQGCWQWQAAPLLQGSRRLRLLLRGLLLLWKTLLLYLLLQLRWRLRLRLRLRSGSHAQQLLLQLGVLLQHLHECRLLIWLLQCMHERPPMVSLSLLGLHLHVPLVLRRLLPLHLRRDQDLLALLLWGPHCGSRGRRIHAVAHLRMIRGHVRLPMFTGRLAWLCVNSRSQAALMLPRLCIRWLRTLLHLMLGLRPILGLAERLTGLGLPRVLLMHVRLLAALLVLLQRNVAQAQALQV